MSVLSIDEIKTLVEQSDGLCVSIYMPVTLGAQMQQNPIRFKNLLREAQSSLEANGLTAKEASEIIQPIQDIINSDESFWQQQYDGLAIFLSSGVCNYYSVPLDFDELVIVANHFHLKPLLPALRNDGRYYVLALSQKDVKLFQCTRSSVKEIKLEGVPKSLDETLQYDETAKDGQRRMSTPKGGTNNSFQHAGSFHGQGSPDQDKNHRDIEQFFHAVDGGLHKYLRGKRAPLVLAAVEYLFPIYRGANTYEHLVEAGITGSPENAKPEDLQAQAWEIVEPIFLQEIQEAINHYKELTATGRTSNDIKEAVSAAYFGRVDQLFVAVGVQQWGSFNPETNTIELHPDPEVGDEDLLNAAAIQTILNGGTVYAVEPEKVPDDAPLAAVFRY